MTFEMLIELFFDLRPLLDNRNGLYYSRPEDAGKSIRGDFVDRSTWLTKSSHQPDNQIAQPPVFRS